MFRVASKSSIEDPPSSAEKLIFQDENKGLLWGHYHRWKPALLSYSEAIQELLRLQCCDLGGTKNDGPGATQGNCVLGRIVLPLGDSLRKSLLLNLHQYSPLNDIPSKFTNEDFPLWLHESIEEKTRQPSGLLDYLTYPNRRIFLIQDGSHVVGACIHRGQKPHGSTEPWELWQAYDNRGETLKLNYRKSSWRDAEALLHPTKDKAHKPKIFDWLTKCQKTGFVPKPLSVQVLGFAWEDKAGKPGHWIHDTMTIPQVYLDSEEAYYALVRALKYAEAVGELFSAKTYAPVADALNLASKPQQKDDDRRRFIRNVSSISSSYWSALDAEFQQFMFDLAEDKEVDEDIIYGGKTIPMWKEKLKRIATEFYEQSLFGVSSYEARARGLNAWDKELREVLEKK